MKAIQLKFLVLIILAMAISACATMPVVTELSKEQFIENQKVKDDPYSSVLTLTGMTILNVYTENLSSERERYYLISSVNKKTGQIKHSATFLIAFPGNWRYYDSVRFLGGSSRKASNTLQDVTCHVGSCTYIETIIVDFTHDELKKQSEEGLSFQVTGRQSPRNPVVSLPKNYVQAQIEGAEALQSQVD